MDDGFSARIPAFIAGPITGPLIASLFMDGVGAGGLYLYCALAHLGLAAYVVVRVYNRGEAAPRDHTEFSDALTSALTASRIYEEEMGDGDPPA